MSINYYNFGDSVIDFLAIIPKHDNCLKEFFVKLLDFSREKELCFFERGTSYNAIILTSKCENLIPKFSDCLVFGYFNSDEGVFLPRRDNRLRSASTPSVDIGQYPGEFSAIELGENLAFKNDFFGFADIFFNERDDFTVVSNRLCLLISVLHELDCTVVCDDHIVSLLCFSNAPVFSQQIMSDKTVFQGVNRVSVDQELYFERGTPKLREKKAVVHALSPVIQDTDDSRSLIYNAIQDLTSKTKNIIESSAFDRRIITLSGGKDSRAVLAAVLRSGSDKIRELEVSTSEVPKSRDHIIASGIADLFGLKYYYGSNNFRKISPVDHVKMFLSYHCGQHHRLTPRRLSAFGENLASLTLYGGGGELYRDYYSTFPVFKDALNNCKSIDELSRFVINRFSHTDRAEIKLMAEEELSRSLNRMPGKDLKSKLNNMYFYYRNRAHFGSKGLKQYHDGFMHAPLCEPHLYYAYNKINESDKADFSSDIIKVLHPVLSRIEFDGYPDQGGVRVDSDLVKYFEAKKRVKEKNRIASQRDLGSFQGKGFNDLLIAYLENAENTPKVTSSALFDYIQKELKPLAISMLKNNRKAGAFLSCRLLSLSCI